MKIRKGFVSNSSSSSFIIMAPVGESNKCEHCGRSDPDFFKLINSIKSSDYGELCVHNKEETLNSLQEWKDDYCDEEEASFYERMINLVKNPPKGWKIKEVVAEHREEAFYYVCQDLKQIKILLKEGSINTENIEFAENLKKG